MKKAVIFYFSGTGNTYWAAHKIKETLELEGMQVYAYSIEKISIQQAQKRIDQCDIIGFGYPIYCSDVPDFMQSFMCELKPKTTKSTFVFCTQAGFSGDGGRVSLDFISHSFFSVKWTLHLMMPNNITTSWSPLSYRTNPSQINEMLRKAYARIVKWCGAISEDRICLTGFSKAAKVLGSIQRSPYRKMKDQFRQMISFSPRCTHCGYCEKICPVQNITVTPKGNITYNRCIFCMRCYNFCPYTAIRIYGKDHNIERGATYKGPTRYFKVENLFK